MIVLPKDQYEWHTLASFLQRAGVQPSPDLRVIGWVSENRLAIVVGLNGFLGSLAQIHMAYAPDWHFTPRALLGEVFRYAFTQEKREMLIGVVNSKNTKALRMDLHLGFKELYRLPGMHDDGGDLVLLGMTKDNCRYLGDRWRRGEQDAKTVH